MLENTITLNVDVLNDGTTVPQLYKRRDFFQNRSVYIGEQHSSASKDTLSFYRSYAKRNGNFNGVDKVSCKLSLDMEVLGFDRSTTLIAPMIIEVSISTPSGVAAASTVEARQAIIALLDNDVIMNNLVIRQEV